MADENNSEEERTEASSGRYYWIVVSRDGGVRLVSSQGEYEMSQLSGILGGGGFHQVPVSKMSEHRLAMAYRPLAVTDETRNDAVSAWLGVRSVTGTVVVAKRRDNESGYYDRPREGRRYIVPFLGSEAREVASKLRAEFGK